MPMSSKKAVKVIERIEQLGLTRKAVADAAGVDVRAVYRWLSYEREPTLTIAKVSKICTLLQWTVQQLEEAYYEGFHEAQVITNQSSPY